MTPTTYGHRRRRRRGAAGSTTAGGGAVGGAEGGTSATTAGGGPAVASAASSSVVRSASPSYSTGAVTSGSTTSGGATGAGSGAAATSGSGTGGSLAGTISSGTAVAPVSASGRARPPVGSLGRRKRFGSSANTPAATIGMGGGRGSFSAAFTRPRPNSAADDRSAGSGRPARSSTDASGPRSADAGISLPILADSVATVERAAKGTAPVTASTRISASE